MDNDDGKHGGGLCVGGGGSNDPTHPPATIDDVGLRIGHSYWGGGSAEPSAGKCTEGCLLEQLESVFKLDISVS